jgi:membrane fusion protein (multidrug efflux system)
VGDAQVQAKLILEDGTPYAPSGKLQFSEVSVQSGTGSVTLRSVFPNPQNILLPGMFVHEDLDEGVDEHGMLIPQRAVTHDQRGDATTMVVGTDNKVSTRVIKTERAIGDQWLVSEGVAAGDRVVVVGLQRIQAGVEEVKPREVSLDQLNGDQVASADLARTEAPHTSQSLHNP